MYALLFQQTRKGNSKFLLTEKEKILLKNQEIASEFHENFGKIVDSLEMHNYQN